nr:MAG TPA: hypothetical protein [Caudoviricetes sp.]
MGCYRGEPVDLQPLLSEHSANVSTAMQKRITRVRNGYADSSACVWKCVSESPFLLPAIPMT